MKNGGYEKRSARIDISAMDIDNAYDRLLIAIVRVAYDDLFSIKENIRNTAILFFRDNPYGLSEGTLDTIHRFYVEQCESERKKVLWQR